jgi:hypothetical protein
MKDPSSKDFIWIVLVLLKLNMDFYFTICASNVCKTLAYNTLKVDNTEGLKIKFKNIIFEKISNHIQFKTFVHGNILKFIF